MTPEESREIHDFNGPYQIHTLHTGDDVVFVRNHYGAYSYDSKNLLQLVNGKISEHTTELSKWNILKDRLI